MDEGYKIIGPGSAERVTKELNELAAKNCLRGTVSHSHAITPSGDHLFSVLVRFNPLKAQNHVS